MYGRRFIVGFASLIIVMAYSSYALLRPIAAVAFSPQLPAIAAGQATALAWPSVGQAAVGAVGYGVLDHYNDNVAVPTASVAKLMTCLMVLKAKPLALDQTGPPVPITQAEADAYARYVANGSSTIAVAAGQNLTEYQALQAMLLPSANNIADLLAVWAYGSMEAYAAAASSYAKELGMTQSVFGKVDASGLDPSSVSTASDLVRLGIAAASQPVLAQIAAQKSAVLPVAGTVYTTNALLGADDINGLKTGNTDEAGGVYVFSAQKRIGSKTVTIVGAVAAARTLYGAFQAARPLLNSATANFAEVTALTAGQTVGTATAYNGASAVVKAQTTMGAAVWLPSLHQPTISWTANADHIASGQVVGQARWQVPAGTVTSPIIAARSLEGPTIWWRLTHPVHARR